MKKLLLNDDFIDFVASQMQKNTYILDKIGEYKEYNSEYSKINEIIDNTTDEKEKTFFIDIINCLERMSIYENAFAFYLGMMQTLNMSQLEEQ